METKECKLLSGGEASAALKQFAESYGGEEAMKKNYPRTYQAYQQAISYEKKTAGSKKEETLMEEIPTFNITYVAYTDDKKDHLCVRVDCDLENNTNSNKQSVQIFNRKTKELICTGEIKKIAGIGNGSDNELIIPLKKNNINDLYLTVNIAKIDNGIHSYLWESLLSDYILGEKCSITLDHPCKKYKEHKKIYVSYYIRESFKIEGNDWDYRYEESYNDRMFRLPSQGTIRTETPLTSIMGCVLKVKNMAGKTCYHSNATPHVFIDPINKRLIKWDIPTNWGFRFDDLLELINSDVIYDLTITAGCTTGMMTFNITNNTKANGSSYRKTLPGIIIYKDCFPEGTLVRMQDGSQKRVEDLQEGDSVLCENQQSAKVRFKESVKTKATLGRLVLENGTELTATRGHMVATPQGLISLNLLPAGELVKTVNGNIRVRHTEILPEKECNIVVVGLQSVHRLYINDILAGDSEAVLTEAEKAINIRYQIPEEWRQDYNSMIAGK